MENFFNSIDNKWSKKKNKKKNKTNNNQEMKNLCVTAPPYTHPKGEEKCWYYPRLIMHINELRRGIEMNFFSQNKISSGYPVHPTESKKTKFVFQMNREGERSAKELEIDSFIIIMHSLRGSLFRMLLLLLLLPVVCVGCCNDNTVIIRSWYYLFIINIDEELWGEREKKKPWNARAVIFC